MTYTIGSLFSGYGGLDMGVQAALGPARVAWVSDIEPGPTRILTHHHPDAPNLGDITSVDWTQVEPVDVICGGSPCQDLSAAGRRAGMRPGTRSGLWESMAHAISIIRPRLVVWENVQGALSAEAFSLMESREGRVGDRANRPVLRALGRVLGDLAAIGYDAQWMRLRASDVGACHQRARVFVAAFPEGDSWWVDQREHEAVGDVDGADRGQRRVAAAGETPGGRAWPDAGGPDRAHELVTLPAPTAHDAHAATRGDAWRNSPGLAVVAEQDKHGQSLLPNSRGRRGRYVHPLPTPTIDPGGFNRSDTPGAAIRPSLETFARGERFGVYSEAIRRHELAFGMPAPAPTIPGRTGRRLSPRFVEWMMGLPAGHVTSPEIGLSRVQQLRALGNGVVPQQAAAAVGLMSDRERAAEWGCAA